MQKLGLESVVWSLGFFRLLSSVCCLLNTEFGLLNSVLFFRGADGAGRPPGNRPAMASTPADEAHSSCSMTVLFASRPATRLIDSQVPAILTIKAYSDVPFSKTRLPSCDSP